MLHQHYGENIDSCDTVFRFNQAPVNSFGEYVGSKCTYESLNSAWVKSLLDTTESKVGLQLSMIHSHVMYYMP